MTLTSIDPIPALVLIDLQQAVVSAEAAPHPIALVLSNAAALAGAFRDRHLPVVLVTVTGAPRGRTDLARSRGTAPVERAEGWADLAPELGSHPDDILIGKQTWGAFHRTPLHERLTALGVTQVVLGGVATSAGVESTARAAHEHGYHVVLVTDAMSDRDPEAHRNSTERIFPRLGEVTTTAEILELIGRPPVDARSE